MGRLESKVGGMPIQAKLYMILISTLWVLMVILFPFVLLFSGIRSAFRKVSVTKYPSLIHADDV